MIWARRSGRMPPLRPCGLRVVVSDFLFEADLSGLMARLARGASALFLVQVLDAEDLEPSGGEGARLVDSESGAALEELLTEDVLAAYARRFAEHQRTLRAAAVRAKATLVTAPAPEQLTHAGARCRCGRSSCREGRVSFGFPWGLLALGALVPLVAAYFLRRQQKPVTVSALFLWRTPRPRAEAGPRFERFTREASLLLEALAVVAAALFLADVRFSEDARARHVVLVVDGSLSLSARGPDGVTVLERVRREAAKRVEEERATRVTVLASGSVAAVHGGPGGGALEGAGERWSPSRRWARTMT